VIDDEVEICTFFDFLLQEKGFDVHLATNGNEAKQALEYYQFNLALVDLKLPDTNGIRLLANIKEVQPDCEVIIMTGYSTVKSAVNAIKFGAYDYIEKPFDDLDKLEAIIDRALTNFHGWKLQKDVSMDKLLKEHGIIAAPNSPLVPLLSLAKKIADKNINVLIKGETGVGKEVVARFVHAQSNRSEHPFIAVNCGAFTENLLESELFGHEKGAFTGAQGVRKGIFQIADGGTLFLDEIGDASPAIQVKLLRVLETGEFMRVGGEKTISTDVRVLAATNVNLTEAVKAGNFREDLLYRLEVVELDIPPLRERNCDIPLLVQHFIYKHATDNGKENNLISIDSQVMELLTNYRWPGNIRQLSNVVAQALAVCNGKEIKVEDLPNKIKIHNKRLPVTEVTDHDLKQIVTQYAENVVYQLNPLEIDLKELIEELKGAQDYITKQIIAKVLVHTGEDRGKAAKLLNATPRMIRYIQNEK
jgi:two-component system NtrC family response regulator